MKKQKKFDCVRMKWDIQQKLDNEFAGMSDQEICRIQWEKIKCNKIIAPFLEKVRLIKNTQKRAERGSWEKFMQVLAKVPDAEPEEYDRL